MIRAGETIGLVEQLSWRAIKVRTMEGNSLLIPNSVASRDRLEVFRRGSVPMARTMQVGLEYDLPPARGARRARGRGRGRPGRRGAPGAGRLPRPVPRLLRSSTSCATGSRTTRATSTSTRACASASGTGSSARGFAIAYPVIRQLQYPMGGPLPRRNPADLVLAAVEASALFAPLSAAERAHAGRRRAPRARSPRARRSSARATRARPCS